MPISQQNKQGQWVPAIPLPFYGLKKRCTCGRSFWTEEGYRGHYAYTHIIEGEPPVNPDLIGGKTDE